MRPFALFLALMLWPAILAAESAGGLRWTMPAGWRAQPERPMRAATYTVSAAAGDREPGECAVFYFGRGQGGTVQDNIDRWRSQIQSPMTLMAFTPLLGTPSTAAAPASHGAGWTSPCSGRDFRPRRSRGQPCVQPGDMRGWDHDAR